MKRYGCIILISNPTISHSRKTLQIPIMNVLDCGLTSKLSETLLYKISIYFSHTIRLKYALSDCLIQFSV